MTFQSSKAVAGTFCTVLVLLFLFKSQQNKGVIQNWTEPSLRSNSNWNNLKDDSANVTVLLEENRTSANDTYSVEVNDDHYNPDERQLDFAIIGFGKCGTSFLMKNVLNIPQINFGNKEGNLPHESKFIRNRDVEGIYRMFETSKVMAVSPGQKILNGMKEPNILVKEGSLQFFKKNFKGTKLIVTMRHPVWRFQSAYNFFILRRFDFASANGEGPPSPNDFIGDCGYYCNEQCVAQKQKAICTNQFNIHHFLSRLRWTSMDTVEENSLLGHEEMQRKRLPNEMFLMDLEQMSDKDEIRKEKFERNLEEFLGLESNAIAIGNHTRPKRDTDLFNICDAHFKELRQ